MKSFVVSWHASGYTGTFNYEVVAKSLEMAKQKWEEYAAKHVRKLEYSWEKAKKAVERHYGGYISWKDKGETDKEEGFYELPYNAWNVGSDHLND